MEGYETGEHIGGAFRERGIVSPPSLK